MAQNDPRPPLGWGETRIRVTRPALGPLSAVLLFLTLLFSAGTIVTAMSSLPGPAPAMGALTLLFAWLAFRSRHWFLEGKTVAHEGAVRVDDEGITFAGGNVTPRKDIAHGLASNTGVRIFEKGGGWLDFDGPRSEARAMLDRLGLGVGHQAAHIVVNRAARANALGVVPFFSALGFARFASAGWVLTAVATALLLAVNVFHVLRTLRLPSKVGVGLDVVAIHRPIGGTLSIPVRRITEVASDLGGAHLTLEGGEHVSIPCDKAMDAELVAERVREAIEAVRTEAPPIAALLVREGRPVGDWLSSLRALLTDEGVGKYRVAVDRPALLATLEDPSASAEARVGAAVALRERLDDDGRAKLRVAIDTAADVPLRVALEAVAEGDEEELERALERLKGESSPSP